MATISCYSVPVFRAEQLRAEHYREDLTTKGVVRPGVSSKLTEKTKNHGCRACGSPGENRRTNNQKDAEGFESHAGWEKHLRPYYFSAFRNCDHIRQRSYVTIQPFLLFARSSLAEGRQVSDFAEDRKGSAMRTFYTLRWMVRYAQDYCALFRLQPVWILMIHGGLMLSAEICLHGIPVPDNRC